MKALRRFVAAVRRLAGIESAAARARAHKDMLQRVQSTLDEYELERSQRTPAQRPSAKR